MYTISHEQNRFVAEIAREQGIQTASILAFNYGKNAHFDQGFDIKKVRAASKSPGEINANLIVDDAIKQVESWQNGDEPNSRFFLWLHFYEPHFPYTKHKEIDFGDNEKERYLAEIHYVDQQLGRLFGALAEQSILDDTAIVFTGDHGEEFAEHGGRFHGDLYPEDLHVPLFFSIPGMKSKRVDTPIGLIDVGPTILDLLGVPIPEEYDGESLLALMRGEKRQQTYVFSERIPDVKVPHRSFSLTNEKWHFIRDFRLGTTELYDVALDPWATHNLFLEKPDEVQEMEILLRQHLETRVGPILIDK